MSPLFGAPGAACSLPLHTPLIGDVCKKRITCEHERREGLMVIGFLGPDTLRRITSAEGIRAPAIPSCRCRPKHSDDYVRITQG